MTTIILLGIAYFIIGIFIASFFATYMETKTGKPVADDYEKILITILIGVFWCLGIFLIPVFLLMLLVSKVAKFASYCAKEVLSPRENV